MTALHSNTTIRDAVGQFEYEIGDRLETEFDREFEVVRRYIDPDSLILRYKMRQANTSNWVTVDQDEIESWERVD